MSTNNLLSKHCVPCEGNQKPLSHVENIEYLSDLNTWNLIDDSAIEKKIIFKDFKEALKFVNLVGDLAESEGHHPDIEIYNWNRVRVNLSTHAIHGLSENDFIMASKIDDLYKKQTPDM